MFLHPGGHLKATSIVLLGCGYLAACSSTEPIEPKAQAAGLLVTVTTQFSGTGWPTSFLMHVDGAGDLRVPANGSLLVTSIAPGDHSVAIRTPLGGGSFCTSSSLPRLADGWFQQIGTVEPDGRGHMNFKFECIP